MSEKSVRRIDLSKIKSSASLRNRAVAIHQPLSSFQSGGILVSMIQPASAILCCLPFLVQSLFAQEQAKAAEDELKRIQQILAQAWLSKDRPALEGLLAPEWSVTDISGNVLSRDTVLKDLDTGNRVIESFKIDDVRVRVYGSTAVVTGRTMVSGRYQGQEARVQLRFTDVFVNTAGAWKAVASHSTEIRQPR